MATIPGSGRTGIRLSELSQGLRADIFGLDGDDVGLVLDFDHVAWVEDIARDPLVRHLGGRVRWGSAHDDHAIAHVFHGRCHHPAELP